MEVVDSKQIDSFIEEIGELKREGEKTTQQGSVQQVELYVSEML